MDITIRVGGVPEHFNLPWRLAIEDGAFATLGVDVAYSDWPAGTGAMTGALRDGELDLALVLTEGAVLDVLKGSDNRLIKVFVESPLTWGIHVAANGDIRTTEQTEGKRVAISRYGSGSHLIAVVDALERGFDLADMSFVLVENLDGARKALANDEADVFLWEKHMTQPLVTSGEFRRVGERAVPWPAFVVSARGEFVAEHAEAAKAVLDTVHQFAQQLKQRDDAVALISSRYHIAAADAEHWLVGVQWCGNYDRPAAALQRVVAALHAQGAIKPAQGSNTDIWYDI
jgi:ABC-type nitrate/sulfonate/bicarbonate transport system substrate-binding protein